MVFLSRVFLCPSFSFFFFFHDTATTEFYTLSLHDALPISLWLVLLAIAGAVRWQRSRWFLYPFPERPARSVARSEEHTSELQSQSNLVCRLLLEKKKKKKNIIIQPEYTPTTRYDIPHKSLI